MDILLTLHSLLRWVLVAVMAVTAIVLLLAWLRPSDSGMDRRLMTVFLGVLDTQVLLGIILIVWMGVRGGGFARHQIEHAITMLVAVFVAHLSARWRKAEVAVRARNNFFVLLGVLVLIVLGVNALPQGWTG
ncbi:MAG TPA: hypothetical protein VF707_06730 [Ardenticatenaceae bacterium]|jgi:hypothetical protein